MANKTRSFTVTLDKFTYELLLQEAYRDDVRLATKARHLIKQSLKENIIRRKIESEALIKIITDEQD